MLSQTERHQERTITKQDSVWVKPLGPKLGVLCTLRERMEAGYMLCQVQEPQASRTTWGIPEGGGLHLQQKP